MDLPPSSRKAILDAKKMIREAGTCSSLESTIMYAADALLILKRAGVNYPGIDSPTMAGAQIADATCQCGREKPQVVIHQCEHCDHADDLSNRNE